MGTGASLPIQHMVQSFFHSPYVSTVLKFNQMLHLPSITKNLVSVSRFATDIHGCIDIMCLLLMHFPGIDGCFFANPSLML